MGYDLSSYVLLVMDWLMLHEPLSKQILKGYSLGVILPLA